MGCSAYVKGVCEVSGSGCMFVFPDSKACAEKFGEGPDAITDKCEDCTHFYLEKGIRCCELEPLSSGIKDGRFVESKYIDEDVACCGAFKIKECGADE